jgi:hypothetical protein
MADDQNLRCPYLLYFLRYFHGLNSFGRHRKNSRFNSLNAKFCDNKTFLCPTCNLEYKINWFSFQTFFH